MLPSIVRAPTIARITQLAVLMSASLSMLFRLLAEVRAHPPQVGEGALRQRGAQVRDAFAAARAPLGPDHTLDHLHVVGAPQGQALVHLDEHLAERDEVGVGLGVLVDAYQRLQSPLFGLARSAP